MVADVLISSLWNSPHCYLGWPYPNQYINLSRSPSFPNYSLKDLRHTTCLIVATARDGFCRQKMFVRSAWRHEAGRVCNLSRAGDPHMQVEEWYFDSFQLTTDLSGSEQIHFSSLSFQSSLTIVRMSTLLINYNKPRRFIKGEYTRAS